jgi:hypothetical protein
MPAHTSQPISPPESARYTGDQLEALRKIASGQGQNLLAHLLELAQIEARLLARGEPPVATPSAAPRPG